jgi:hypothetical protein
MIYLELLCLVLPLIFFYLGMSVHDHKCRARIRDTISAHIDPILLEGDTLEYLRCMAIMDDNEIRSVIEAL